MSESKKVLDFQAIIADAFKTKLSEAKIATIVRRRGASIKLHLQGCRKKHILHIRKIKNFTPTAWSAQSLTFKIVLESQRMLVNYIIWDSDQVSLEDPDLDIDFDAMADKVIEFMGYISEIDKALAEAHDIFPKKWRSSSAGFNADKKRVPRSSV